MSILKWKGELGDGHVHMTAREFCEHRTRERTEQQRQILRKVGNNPILNEETKMAVRYAVYALEDNELLRKRIEDLQEQIENMKKGDKPCQVRLNG